jgi:hypothetical protein
MAINLISRPRIEIANVSPGGQYFSAWNSSGRFDTIIYSFQVTQDSIDSRLQINIKEFGSDLLLASNSYRPFKVGTIDIDVTAFVRPYLYSNYSPDANSVNSIDVGGSLRFYIEYTEIKRNDPNTTFVSDKQNPIYAVHSANQVGDVNGSNLKEYVGIQEDITPKAKFLTEFETPVAFEGYPFYISFLFDSNLGGKELALQQVEKSGSLSVLEDNDYELDKSKINRVNHLKLQPITNNQTSFVTISLKSGNDAPDFYVDEGYVDEGYVQIIN